MERCSEIVIGIVSAIVADLLFSPRSIKQEVDRELDALIVAQYQLMQLCIKHGDSEEVDKARAGWFAARRRWKGCAAISIWSRHAGLALTVV